MTTTFLPAPADLDRDTAIRDALRIRTGRTWSVTGGRGTSWGWITIQAPPKRRNGDTMTDDDQATLAAALDLPYGAHRQGVTVAASSAHRREYVNRARGLAYTAAPAYWD